MYGSEVISDCDARYLTEEDDLLGYVVENVSFFLNFLDDADYRVAMSEGWIPEEWKEFEEWFDEEYTCYMVEIDFDDLVYDWKSRKEE